MGGILFNTHNAIAFMRCTKLLAMAGATPHQRTIFKSIS